MSSADDGTSPARRIEIGISKRLSLPVPFARAYPEPIRMQRHLFNTFDCILEQLARHGLDWDPFHDASNLPDLLGLRVMGAYTIDNVRRHLPRVDRKLLYSYLGREAPLEGEVALDRLAEATLAASGLGSFIPAGARARAARRAALAVADGQLRAPVLAKRLGIGLRSVFRLRRSPVDPALVRAIRLQLALRSTAADLDSRGNLG